MKQTVYIQAFEYEGQYWPYVLLPNKELRRPYKMPEVGFESEESLQEAMKRAYRRYDVKFVNDDELREREYENYRANRPQDDCLYDYAEPLD